MGKTISVIANNPASAWIQAASEALELLGRLQVVPEQHAFTQAPACPPHVIIVDAAAIEQPVVPLVERLHQIWPAIPIIVATTSPTWQRARQVFLAGAADYIRQSFDKAAILASVREALERTANA